MDINRLLVSQPTTPHLEVCTPTYLGSPTPGSSSPSTVPSSSELAAIQEELQTVLEYVDHGMILKSFDTLSRLTDIIVTNCEQLGLVSDNAASTSTTKSTASQEIDQKAGFWTGLNNCWLFAFSHYANARSQDQQLKEPHLHHLHNSVKTWADALEKYGLVNYEMGLWEQDILEAIEVCLISASLFSSSGVDDLL
ncbi:hypothetical protein BG006_008916 [Podila minutissima]|uniref:Uncharacterized protein n=1 Tax=Podila minutissima TaxID=64525 RepID=A0A9P5SFH0_9FUNG|nr:hypothetical protein BG006_008916 [Podila minutissima]